MRSLSLFAVVTLALFFASAAQAANDRDPWEGFNRKVFAFNETFDRWVMKPVARGYRAVTPAYVDRGVTRFFGNLHDVADIVNYALQGEPANSRDSALRVIGNTTVGLGGLLDPASTGGIPNRDTDFGLTLGTWGVGTGNYLVLPFLGPSTLRDTAGIPVDWTLHPLPMPWSVVDDESSRYLLEALAMVDTRADLLDVEQAVVGDRYSFLRDVYLQHRDFEVNGESEHDPFLDDEPLEEEMPAEGEPEAAATPAAEAEEAVPEAAFKQPHNYLNINNYSYLLLVYYPEKYPDVGVSHIAAFHRPRARPSFAARYCAWFALLHGRPSQTAPGDAVRREAVPLCP